MSFVAHLLTGPLRKLIKRLELRIDSLEERVTSLAQTCDALRAELPTAGKPEDER